ncbi:MAG: MarR family transcriptional regulator [Actinomycetota bacterium]|nr:MarR family transcriptional regulator [Actinomycetota bacterium]
MSKAQHARLTNVLGALTLALADGIREATEAAAGLTGSAPVALIALHQFLGGRTTQELADATGLTHSGAVRLIDRLDESGLVERRPGRDGRSLAIVLTAAGRALSRDITVARAAAVEGSLGRLGDAERQRLLGLVENMVGTITAQRLAARAGGEEPAWLCRMCDAAACRRPQGECPAANAAQAIVTTGAGRPAVGEWQDTGHDR